MKLAEIREKFVEYFTSKSHRQVKSSPLVPANDPTLLFTNAGMVQFKDVFLGNETRPYTRAVSVQRCLRAGGKHNDLENVGYTARHHTFFEMLGNFSFGDYFKREAIFYAWEFLTKELGLPKEKLSVTVYQDDKESEEIWLNEVKIPANKLSHCGEADNFWSMGDTGPCGPCTEIFYDHGEHIENKDDRFIEIWNVVFMQYDRAEDGKLIELPNKCVDTGMGLERIAAVMQGVHSNYEIDLFKVLIAAAKKIVLDCRVANAPRNDEVSEPSLRVIADHIRATSFLITDGIIPSNEGRGYVLRRIIRRALRHGHKLGVNKPFFYKLVTTLVTEMGGAYPELKAAEKVCVEVIKQEEEQFLRTLDQGMQILEENIKDLKDKIIPGTVIFKLYDTYGFPVDLTNDIAREKNLELDTKGFETHMAQARELSAKSSNFARGYQHHEKLDEVTEFVGYEENYCEAKVIAIIFDNKKVESIKAGDEAVIILDKTPFYAEGGGQIGDEGFIDNFKVINTTKQQQAYLHHGKLESGSLKVEDKVAAKIDFHKRSATMRNHTATHLLHAALKEVLGSQVMQKGSYVGPDYLRFDFSYHKAVGSDLLEKIEHIVNFEILKNTKAQKEVMRIEEAEKKGAVALFGEKYGEVVRVLELGNGFSVELCGGTHVDRTGDIGSFIITKEEGISSGVRRIEALTGMEAIKYIETQSKLLQNCATKLKTTPEFIDSKLDSLQKSNKILEKEIDSLKQKLSSNVGNNLLNNIRKINNINILIEKISGTDSKSLRNMVDNLKSQLESAIIILATVDNNKVNLIVGVTKQNTKTISAGDIIKIPAEIVGGKGGGRTDLAQAGGNSPDKLDEALQKTFEWLQKELG